MSENPSSPPNPSWQSASTSDQSTTSFAVGLQKENSTMKSKKMFVPALVVIILLGLGTGLVTARLTAPAVTTTQVAPTQMADVGTQAKPAEAAVKVGQVFGAKDASAFKDSVEGVLVAGGVGGEGSHHIVRVGGASQNVYLTSSIVDLKLFEGAKVKVSGETFKGQKAGWLMDVGRVEVKELNSALPDGAKAETTQQGNE